MTDSKVTLTEAERDFLWERGVSGGPVAKEAVEMVIAARVSEALKAAAERLNKERDECKNANEGICHVADQMRLEWIAAEYEKEAQR